MLTDYVRAAMGRAKYRILEDEWYFGEIPGLQGVWANAKSLAGCRDELREVLEDWLIVKLRDGDAVVA
jgi:predicted RNase H-like HicB family nuclease